MVARRIACRKFYLQLISEINNFFSALELLKIFYVRTFITTLECNYLSITNLYSCNTVEAYFKRNKSHCYRKLITEVVLVVKNLNNLKEN